MIIIKNNELDLRSIVDVINYKHLVTDLQEAIIEYIIGNQQRTIIDGEPANVFHVSGFANQHHEKLSDYLNCNLLKYEPLQAELVGGHFAHYPGRHYWLQIEDLIVDITIGQFADKEIELLDQIRDQIQDQHCFISDNPRNYLYNLYTAA